MINDNILNKYMGEYTESSKNLIDDLNELQESPTRRENEPNGSKVNQQAKSKKKKRKDLSIGEADSIRKLKIYPTT